MFNKKLIKELENKLQKLTYRLDELINFDIDPTKERSKNNYREICALQERTVSHGRELAKLRYDVDLIMKYLNVKEVNYPAVNRLEPKE